MLWSKKDGFPPRIIPFKSDSINVLTGASKTGKSSLIPIIDYCLGSEHCSIPVNTIRDACSWFGIVIETDKGQRLLARREPGSNASTNEMFDLEAKIVEVPETITAGNSTDAKVKASLDSTAALPALALEPESTSGFKGRPSFRDMLAFCFQPQNVIANPNILFFKADLQTNREKLRNVFPFVLNAVTPDILAKRAELEIIRKALRIKERELEVAKDRSQRWLADVQRWVTRSKEFGLLPPEVLESQPSDLLISALRSVPKQSSRDTNVTRETIGTAVGSLLELQEEERQLATQLSVSKRRLSEIEQFRTSVDGYAMSLNIQRERLSLSGWLRQRPPHECVVCGSQNEDSQTTLEKFYVSLKEAESSASQVEPIPLSVQKEKIDQNDRITQLSERLSAIRESVRVLSEQSEEVEKAQFTMRQVDRFIGNLETALETIDAVNSNEGLADEVKDLKRREIALMAQIAEGRIKERIEAAVQRIAVHIATIVPTMDAERPNAPVFLEPNELSLRIVGENRSDWLWEIGSGANWLSYHLATQIALHKYFSELRHSPVPSFLFLDQPSQVYFPKGWDASPEGQVDMKDKDVEALRRIYETLSTEVSKLKGHLQVVVLDHPGEPIWSGISNVNFVEDWHGDTKLIPLEWLEEKKEPKGADDEGGAAE